MSRSAVHSHLISIWLLLLLPFRMRCVPFIKCREWLCRPFDCNCLRFFTPKMFPIRKSISNWISKLVGIMLLHNIYPLSESACKHTHTHTQRTTAWKHRTNNSQAQIKQMYHRCWCCCWRWCDDSLIFIFGVRSLFTHPHISRAAVAVAVGNSHLAALSHPSRCDAIRCVWIISHYFHAMMQRFFAAPKWFSHVSHFHNF